MNPSKFFADVFKSIRIITNTLVMGPFKFIMIMLKKIINGLFQPIFSSLWGWDKVPTDGDDYENSIYHNSVESCRGKKCYVSKSGKVPFSVLMGTILCPPIGVFMEYGISGWLNIIMCTLLTLVYYFPGLMYALFTIYS